MNLAIQSTTARTWKQVKAQHLLAVAAALAIAFATASGGWQLSRGDNSSAPSAKSAPVVTAAAAPRDQGMTYYLVASQAQADRLLGAIVAQRGEEARGNVRFVVATDDGTLNQTVQLIVHENDMLYSNGLPEIKLIDLRGQ